MQTESSKAHTPPPQEGAESSSVQDLARRYWDTDALTYDHAPEHGWASASEAAAWLGLLRQHLPPPPARVLDMGAGTGFLAVGAALLGHHVVAADLSPVMLSRAQERAERHGVVVETTVSDACRPPAGPFDAVVSRHLLWTLPDPVAALAAWRRVAAGGRLVLFETAWGRAHGASDVRRRVRSVVDRLSRRTPSHHAPYPEALRRSVAFPEGIRPDELCDLVAAAGWPSPSLYRADAVEWTRRLAQSGLDRWLGVDAVYLVVSGDSSVSDLG